MHLSFCSCAIGRLLFGSLIYLLCSLPAWSQGSAAAPLVLGNDIPFGVVIDAEGKSGPDDIAAMPEEQFSMRSSPLADGYRHEVFWLRFYLPSAIFAGEERWLEIFPPYVDNIRLYSRTAGSGGSWQLQQGGDLTHKDRQRLDYRFLVLPLAPPAGDALEVLIRVETSSFMLLEGKFWQPRDFTEQATRSTAFWSFYLGLAVLAALLAIALTVILRSRVMLAVSSFSISYVFLASMQGFSQWVLFPAWPWFNHHLTSVSNLLLQASMIWVGREALQLYRYFPRLDRVFLLLIFLLLLMPLSIPLNLYGSAVKISFFVSEVAKVFLVLVSIILWLRVGVQFAFIGMVYGLFTVGSILAVLTLLGWIPLIPGAYLFWQNILVVLMLVVSAVSVYRVAQENRQLRDKERLTRELEIERDASFRQRQFLGMVSHEFRTPLSVISAVSTNMLIDPPVDEEQLQQRVEKVQRATRRLIQLSDNCLADARIAADMELYQPGFLNLFEVLRDAADIVAMSGTHQLQLLVNKQAVDINQIDSVCYVWADSALLRIAFSNLLDNAVKFSTPGPVVVKVARLHQCVEVEIVSYSPAIPPELAANIFDRYVKGGNKSTGAGLGLYVARQIILAHGGDVHLSKSDDQETIFKVSLPVNDGNNDQQENNES